MYCSNISQKQTIKPWIKIASYTHTYVGFRQIWFGGGGLASSAPACRSYSPPEPGWGHETTAPSSLMTLEQTHIVPLKSRTYDAPAHFVYATSSHTTYFPPILSQIPIFDDTVLKNPK